MAFSEESSLVARKPTGTTVSTYPMRDQGYRQHSCAVPIIALETHGSACFYHSVSVNTGRWNADKPLKTGITTVFDESYNVKVAHVEKLTSRAASLGATSPAAGVVKMALERAGGINCITVPDEMSMEACGYFAGVFSVFAPVFFRERIADFMLEDHKLMVELACSTTLVPGYSKELFGWIASKIESLSPGVGKTLLFIVCGGSKISLDEMVEYKGIVERVKEKQTVFFNGEEWQVQADLV